MAAMGTTDVQILTEGVGYAVVLGIGLLFAVVMTGLTAAQQRYSAVKASADEFNTASRSIKPGLIASGVVSAWTWAATLLQSTTVCYEYGVSGPYWYSAGATIQVLMFAMLAVKVKQNANGAKTWLEIVRARFGTASHIIFMCFALITNILVSSMLLLGGSAVVTALTGMDTYAANFLIPLGVSLYVYFGGLRATLLCDWSHTAVLIIIILYFALAFYTPSVTDTIGSASDMWERVTAAGRARPVAGNSEGSYLTMQSQGGIIFAIINVVGNFGTVFLDQVYFQRAIASRPETAVQAYILGGLAWLALPLTFATTMGLGAIALGVQLTAADVSAGLVAPAAAAVLLGPPGAVAMLILLFLAVTSAASAEIIAVSSIITYDIYRPYINTAATAADLARVGHIGVVAFALFMGCSSSFLHAVGLSLGWVYLFMGVVIGAGVVPLALTITWSKTNRTAATIAPVVGACCGVFAWLLTAGLYYNGELTIASTGSNYPMLAGNVISIGVGAVVVLTGTLLYPDNYDFVSTRAIGTEIVVTDDIDLEAATAASARIRDVNTPALQSAFMLAAKMSVLLTLALIVLLPLTLYGTGYVYSKGFFTGWIVVSILWTFCSGFAVVVYPVYESKEGLREIMDGVIGDIRGRHQQQHQEAIDRAAAAALAASNVQNSRDIRSDSMHKSENSVSRSSIESSKASKMGGTNNASRTDLDTIATLAEAEDSISRR